MTDKKEKISNINTSLKTSEIDNLNGLLAKIYNNFSISIKPNIITCFESLDDTLFDIAEKADSNKQQTLYFESMRLIRKNRSEIFKTFFNSLKSTFTSFKNNDFDYFQSDKNYDPKIKSLSLSLLDEKELDETLAKTNLINKSEMAYHKHIFAFEKRFSVLASGTKLNSNQIPLGPYVIVNSFSKCIQNLNLSVNIKLIVYKIFERTVMGCLNEIYKNTNELIAEKGIVPEITYNIGRNNQGNTNNPISQNSPSIDSNDQNNSTIQQDQINTTNNNGDSQQHNDSNYQLISQLFSHSHRTNPNNPQDTKTGQSHMQGNANQTIPATNIDMGSMLNALTLLQSNVRQNIDLKQNITQSPTQIKEQLLKQLHELDDMTTDQTVKQQDEDTIDLVGMLFQFLVDDRNLPETIQVILAKLQIPYLKIALEDKNLFANKIHPARLLLDKMSLASISWSKQSDLKMHFLSKIEGITYKILQMDEYQNENFEKLLKHFNNFLQHQKKRANVATKRTKEKTLGQDRINQAKKITAKILVEKMTNKQMPIIVRDIILGEWSNVLNLTYLRHTPESKEYIEKVEFVNEIINYSQKNDDRNVTLKDIQNLSITYSLGLKLVAFNQKESKEKQLNLFKCLSSIHQLENNESQDEFEIISPEEILKLSEIKKQEHEIVDFIEEIIEPKEVDIDTSTIDKSHFQTVKTLEKGVWLEFLRKDKTTIRAKLSWISPITGKFLFVNSRGLKVTDRTKNEIAIGLQDKSILVLNQVPIFDRALSAIATQLKKEK